MFVCPPRGNQVKTVTPSVLFYILRDADQGQRPKIINEKKKKTLDADTKEEERKKVKIEVSFRCYQENAGMKRLRGKEVKGRHQEPHLLHERIKDVKKVWERRSMQEREIRVCSSKNMRGGSGHYGNCKEKKSKSGKKKIRDREGECVITETQKQINGKRIDKNKD